MKPSKTRCLYCNKELPGIVSCDCFKSIEEKLKDLKKLELTRIKQMKPKKKE